MVQVIVDTSLFQGSSLYNSLDKGDFNFTGTFIRLGEEKALFKIVNEGIYGKTKIFFQDLFSHLDQC